MDRIVFGARRARFALVGFLFALVASAMLSRVASAQPLFLGRGPTHWTVNGVPVSPWVDTVNLGDGLTAAEVGTELQISAAAGGGVGIANAGAGLTASGSVLAVGAGTCASVGADTVGVNLDCAPTWTGTHTHQGRILLPNGSNAAPAISFTNDADTGLIYSAGSGITQFGTIIDAQTVIMCSTLDCTFGPRVMVAATGNATAPAYTWSQDGNTGFFGNNNDIIAVSTGGTERARWNTTGYGIGVAASAPFSLKSHTNFTNSERNMRTHGIRTTDATQTHSTIVTMTVDGTRCWVQVNVQADGSTGTSHGTYQINGALRRNAGNVSVVGATTTTYFESDASMDVTLTASGNDVRVSVTGLGAGDSTIDWAASSAWQCVTSNT